MTDTDEMAEPIPPVPLSIKCIAGGGLEDKEWTAGISDLQASLRRFRSSGSDPFGLTVAYFIPGEVYSPTFYGIRISTFLEQHGTLVVQVALPAHPGGDARAELLEFLDRAIDRAESWGRRKNKLSSPLAEIRRIAMALRAGS